MQSENVLQKSTSCGSCIDNNAHYRWIPTLHDYVSLHSYERRVMEWIGLSIRRWIRDSRLASVGDENKDSPSLGLYSLTL